MPLEIAPAEFDALGQLGWRRVVLPKARFPGLARDFDTFDFSGWPIYTSASLPEQMAYDICGALAAREAEVPWEKDTGGSALHMVSETDVDADGRAAPPGRRALVSRAQMIEHDPEAKPGPRPRCQPIQRAGAGGR